MTRSSFANARLRFWSGPVCLLAAMLMCCAVPTRASALDLFGILSGPSSSGAMAGHLVKINPVTGVGTDVGVPLPGIGLTGLCVDSLGRLLATTDASGGNSLIQINPMTGAYMGTLASLTYLGGVQSVTDLAFDPTTGKMYASSAFGAFGNNELLEVNMSTGALTDVGAMFSEGGFHAVASSSSGKLYSISTFGLSVFDVDPGTAGTLGSYGLGAATEIGALGMTVASDGRIFFTNGNDAGMGVAGYGRDLWVTDPSTGVTTLIGSIGVGGNVHDLAFLTVPEPATMGICSVLALACFSGLVRKRTRK